MADQNIITTMGEAGDPLSRGDLLCKVYNGLSVLEVVRQRLLVAEEQPLRPEEPLGMATMLATVIDEINNAITDGSAINPTLLNCGSAA